MPDQVYMLEITSGRSPAMVVHMGRALLHTTQKCSTYNPLISPRDRCNLHCTGEPLQCIQFNAPHFDTQQTSGRKVPSSGRQLQLIGLRSSARTWKFRYYLIGTYWSFSRREKPQNCQPKNISGLCVRHRIQAGRTIDFGSIGS